MSTVSSLLPNGFPAYARVFHPAYLNDDEEQPVRWSTVASWTGRTVHPLMQFQRVAGLPEGPHFNTPDPPWGSHPTVGSIPEAECRTLFETLRGFTTTPGYFCLWEGWGNIDIRLYNKRLTETICCSAVLSVRRCTLCLNNTGSRPERGDTPPMRKESTGSRSESRPEWEQLEDWVRSHPEGCWRRR